MRVVYYVVIIRTINYLKQFKISGTYGLTADPVVEDILDFLDFVAVKTTVNCIKLQVLKLC